MKKYLGWFAFFLLLSILFNVKHEQYADKSAANSRQDCGFVFFDCAPESKRHPGQTKGNAEVWWERGYVFFGWPNGTTIWALVITFAVIAEQTMETRKAAENAGKQIEFQKEVLRPRLKITEFLKNPFTEAMEGEWVFVNMKISNSGGLPAYGVIADTWIEFVHGVPPYKFTPLAKYERADHPLNIHSGAPSGFFIPLHRKLTEEERRIMANAMGAICFRVKLTYRAFADEAHTDDAFMIRPDGMEGIGEYRSET